MAVVVFDPAAFKARYKEFASCDDALLSDYFEESMDILNNTDSSIVRSVDERRRLLWYLTAHKAELGGNGMPGSGHGMVGRISSATQGSVSATSEYAMPKTLTASWYLQTKYGTDYWNATAKYRTFRYRSKKHVCGC